MTPCRLLSRVAVGLLAPTLSGLAIGMAAPVFAARAFETWADALAAEWMRSEPEFATIVQYFPPEEQDRLDRELSPATEEAWEARLALAERGLAELARFSRDTLSATESTSAAMLEWQLRTILEGGPFRDHVPVFHQFRGLHTGLSDFLSLRHPIRNRRDIDNYLARLDQVAVRMDEGIALTRAREQRGFVAPRFILTSTLGQFDRFFEGGVAGNIFVRSLDERVAALGDITPEERAAFVARAASVVETAIIPAYERARALVAAQLDIATDDAGLWRLPRGDEAYAQALRRHTSTTLTAEEIHALGLAEVTRIEARMDGLLRQLGYTEGSVQARYERLEADLQPKEEDPRPRLLAEYTRLMRDAEARADALFDLRPRAPVEVRRVPPITEKTSAAHYLLPAPDGSRPGVFWVPLPGPTYRIAGMRTLTYHEAVPGHHFQIALQQEMTDLPRFRRDRVFGGLTAHAEGWALYAEQLAAEAGWYEGDTVGLIGQLQGELFRARRLVVDTGLHAKRWTRQQAIDYGISATEVERYVVMPGQACSYKIGMMRMLDLRARVQAALGEAYSLKEFHNVVLRAGNLPLDVLDQVIDAYIAERRTAI